MTTTRQPKGVPVGGQFATSTHAEPELNLTQPPTPDLALGTGLGQRYSAAREMYEAYAQNAWVETIKESYPDAAYACVDVEADGGGRYTAGMGLYAADGSDIDLDEEDDIRFENSYDTSWDMGLHQARADKTIFTPRSGVFTLGSIEEHWAAMQAAQEPQFDPFIHLSGMDRARAQSQYAQTLNQQAAAAYVKDISTKLLAINPDAARLYVNRRTDVEYGLTFRLDRVEDMYRNVVDVDLSVLEDDTFQDVHMDPFVDFDESTEELYVNIDPGN